MLEKITMSQFWMQAEMHSHFGLAKKKPDQEDLIRDIPNYPKSCTIPFREDAAIPLRQVF